MSQSTTLARLLTGHWRGTRGARRSPRLSHRPENQPRLRTVRRLPRPEESPRQSSVSAPTYRWPPQRRQQRSADQNPLTLSGGVNRNSKDSSQLRRRPLRSQTESPRRRHRPHRADLAARTVRQRSVDPVCETELAGEPANFTIQSVTLPIKVHLTNPAGLLGSTCYLGSNSEPIVLHLTTGTTNPRRPTNRSRAKPTFSRRKRDRQIQQRHLRGQLVRGSGRQRLQAGTLRVHPDQHQRPRRRSLRTSLRGRHQRDRAGFQHRTGCAGTGLPVDDPSDRCVRGPGSVPALSMWFCLC